MYSVLKWEPNREKYAFFGQRSADFSRQIGVYLLWLSERSERNHSILWPKSTPSHNLIRLYYIDTRVQKVAKSVALYFVDTRVQKVAKSVALYFVDTRVSRI